MVEASELDIRERALSRAVAEHEEAAEQLAVRAARTAAESEHARAAMDAAEQDREAATEMRRVAEASQRELDALSLKSETKLKVRFTHRIGIACLPCTRYLRITRGANQSGMRPEWKWLQCSPCMHARHTA